jgi:hypothetical protein
LYLFGRIRAAVQSAIGTIKNRQFALYMLCFGASFLLFTPFALLDFRNFFTDFKLEMKHLVFGHLGIIIQRGWWYHARYTLPYGMGWIMFLSSITGIGLFIKKHLKHGLILFMFPFVYYCSAGRGLTVFLRYMIPVLPFLCIAAALAVITLYDWLAEQKKTRLLFPMIVVILITEPLYHVIRFNSLISRKDNRLIAADWLNESVPTGSHIHQTGSRFAVIQPGSIPKSTGYLDLKLQWTYHPFTQPWAHKTMPDYIVLQQSPIKGYDRIPDALARLIMNEYQLIKKFEAATQDASQNWYDQLDAFYLPFRGFTDVTRPGPNIFIYRLIRPAHRNRIYHAMRIH